MISKNIYGVILAAGFSSRHPLFKPLAKYKDKYYIQNIIDKLKDMCLQITVVTGFRSNLLKKRIKELYPGSEKITFIENKDFAKGMFSSVKAAAVYHKKKISENDLVLMHLVDQPQIFKQTYQTLIKTANNGNSDVYIPGYEMQAGHPIIAKRKVILEICNSSYDNTLRDVLKKFSISYIKVPDRNILKDIDIDEDEKSLE